MKQLRTKFRTFTRFRFIYIAKHLSLIPGLVYTLLMVSYVYHELNTDWTARQMTFICWLKRPLF